MRACSYPLGPICQSRPIDEHLHWMEVLVEGDGRTRWVLDDEGGSQGSSMARTTGAITCATVEHLLEANVPAGVHPPEALGTSFLDRCLTHYAANEIRIVETRER